MRLISKQRFRPLSAIVLFLFSTVTTAVFAFTAPQQISPRSVVVHLELAQQFTSAGATKWSASEGVISSSGLFVAPKVMPKSSTVTITATGPGGTAKATVKLVGGARPVITPNLVHLALGKTQQFKSPGATSWTAEYGKITSSGLYTAPSLWEGKGEDHIYMYGPHGSTNARVFFIQPAPVILSVPSGRQVPVGVISLTVQGKNVTNESFVLLNHASLATVLTNGLLHATGFIRESGTATVQIANGTSVSDSISIQVGVKNPKVSDAAARRFLEQAAFGPAPADILAVQELGFDGWIKQQIDRTPCSTYSRVKSKYNGMPEQFLTNAVNCPDQLRQRVAFALSQIFVTSLEKLGSNRDMILYQDMLLTDAFLNYRKIMEDVTLSPAMGNYLDMANNALANHATGSAANENYARELMQLFTTGTNLLNPDGTLQYDSTGLPIPTYSQFQVTEFARVYTGWTYPTKYGETSTTSWGGGPTGYSPMVWNASEHDYGSKQLLNGYISPAGASPKQDLDNALSNIFSHPNVGPFVCTQLIQHLVKSNPSPAYVKRVAAVFDDNGSNVRGDMRAVVNAILLDPEARANDEGGDDQPTDGHLQEPALFVAGMVRAFGGTMTDQNYFGWDLANQGQNIFSPASVFNYYAPNTGVQGTNLMGGEFQIYTPNNAVLRANLVSNLFGSWHSWIQSYGPGTTVDLTPFVNLASNPTTMVNALDLTLTHGVMPASMKSDIVAAVEGETGGSLRRAQRAVYLILTSGYYNIWH